MTAGIQISQGEINNQAGAIARNVFAALQSVGEFKTWLDGVSGNDLEATYGFTSTDAAVLKSAFADLADLATVFAGGSPANALPHDYRVFARKLLGTGLF